MDRIVLMNVNLAAGCSDGGLAAIGSLVECCRGFRAIIFGGAVLVLSAPPLVSQHSPTCVGSNSLDSEPLSSIAWGFGLVHSVSPSAANSDTPDDDASD